MLYHADKPGEKDRGAGKSVSRTSFVHPETVGLGHRSENLCVIDVVILLCPAAVIIMHDGVIAPVVLLVVATFNFCLL